ncbi:structural maintenance of chromosomes protein 6B isoform X2 [Arachis ipaensis]|uniref:structural maintenance of chromosomes protein 6B isoform X2 n=1 Tax=Arachis ipaensis TaxID=130454 RepID=UPI0007AFC814|nr:structural maintenance of chromosomes protein 6B isoform X2 [Arachis ipaensis]XP_025643034.1 structural maintenance of chromosomes protein 6B isoform X2 [Arachis hypogaea]QHN99827.1 Structural maintenance of chromosomes protein 6B [Arachis hypogaea]
MEEGMGESTTRVCPSNLRYEQQPQHTAGTIKKIRLENFMCHENFEMEFVNAVNFVLGQNGSGKSAILTALCVAFGSRAKKTDRANHLKDLIKKGCSNAVIHVEIQNEGEDAFKPEIYGDVIIVERRISVSANSIILKDHQGKRVGHRIADLREMVEHFNIDVDNPCVIMSQDKSREFLHSGNDKDKFKFFYKATLLQQVNDLLENISKEIGVAHGIVKDLEGSIKPVEKELKELQDKIKAMEHIEQMSVDIQKLKKKLAWSWVYDVDKNLQAQSAKIDKLKNRIPACQAKIDQQLNDIERLKEGISEKKDVIAIMMEEYTQLNQIIADQNQPLSLARKEALELEHDCNSKTSKVQKMLQRLKKLEQEVQDLHEQHVKNTQAEKSDLEEKLKGLQHEVHAAELDWGRLKEEETKLMNNINLQNEEIKTIVYKIQDHENNCNEISKQIRDYEQKQGNKIAGFGGQRVIHLIYLVEKNHQRFKMPPIGPIGVHLNLLDAKKWAATVEHAIGGLLNSFIVTDHKDFLLLKQLAKEANYRNLQIIIYDFSIPRLKIPQHMLPETNHPSTLSLLQSENDTVINVLVDLGNVERQVLVKDYDTGKVVAFNQKPRNLKEIYTADGKKMFCRGGVETTLPLKGKGPGRLCSSFEDHIKDLRSKASDEQNAANEGKSRKRQAEIKLRELESNLTSVKRHCENVGRSLSSKKLALEEAMHQHAAENSSIPSSSVEELDVEITEFKKKLEEEQILLEALRQRKDEASGKAKDLKVKFDKLRGSAEDKFTAIEKAGSQCRKIESELESAEQGKAHYENLMENKVLPAIKKAEEEYQELTKMREEYAKKASIICPEYEINDCDSLEGCDMKTPDQISAELKELNQKVEHECRRHSEPIADLRMLYEKKQRKIMKRQKVYKALRQKLDACQRALEIRGKKFKSNATRLKQQLSWKFNDHLRKKGISGLIKVNYEEKTLSIEVQMPQDASNRAVRDTRGLSGGERSFSTLCFALALHEMSESPFRAMDEFDVFMDAVSRKISLETLVDFCVAQGSQWLFITPHDTSTVKPGPKVKKMQMLAPRS